MRLIHTADWHLGKHIEGHSRLEEQELFLEDFLDIVKERDADVVLIAGDIYDSSNPPAKAEQLFYDTLKKISEGGRRLTIVIAGNHDNPERLVSATPLAMEHGIIMVGTPKTVIPKGQYGSWEVCRSGEGYIRIERKSEQAVVLTVPFPSERRLEEVLYSEMESEEMPDQGLQKSQQPASGRHRGPGDRCDVCRGDEKAYGGRRARAGGACGGDVLCGKNFK